MDVVKSINKPKMLEKTLNTALISWNNVYPDDSTNLMYILQIENDFKEWRIIYRGSKTQFMVKDLAPCSCYNLRLKSYGKNYESDWINFKCGTDAVPFLVTHLTRAIKFGKNSVIRKIIACRAILLETENKEGKTPLMQSIESGNLQMVTFLLNLGANVNTASLITKRTSLMIALFYGNLQIANCLMNRGADLSLRDCNGLTSLHHAVDSGNYANVELCLKLEFDLNAQDNQGWTPLIRAVILNSSDEIVLLLINKGVDVNLKDKNGFDVYKHLQIANRTHLQKFIAVPEIQEVNKCTAEKSKTNNISKSKNEEKVD